MGGQAFLPYLPPTMPHYHFDDDGNLIRHKASDPYDADTVTEPATTSTPKKKVS